MKLLLRHAALALALLVPLLFASPSEACGPDCSEEALHDDVLACLAGNLGDFALHGPECRAVGFLLLRGMSPADKELITQSLQPRDAYSYSADPSVWTTARQKVPVPPPETALNTEAALGDLYFSNCLAGAFELAAKTLEERIAKSGVNSPEVAGWAKAQDAVFLNCASDTQVLPEPAPAGAPPTVRADRAYQTAAALFYARAFDEAIQKLDAIAQDKSSPWRAWARLVAVRAVIRQATLKTSEEEAKRALLEKARERCVAIVKNTELKDIHRQTRQLTWFIDYRLRPDKQLNVLGRVLLEKPDANFGYAWRDYFQLRGEQPASNDELSLFLAALDGKKEGPSALEEWKKRRSLPWLVAAMAQVSGTEPELPELLAQSESVPKTSPAFVSLRAARARLALKGERWDEARKEFLSVLEPNAATLHPATALSLAEAFRRSALTFEEWAPYAHLTPQSAGSFFSLGVPLSRFKDPKVLAALDPKLRREVVLGGWTRAVLLDRWDEAKALEPHVEAAAAQGSGHVAVRAPLRRAEPARLRHLRRQRLVPRRRHGLLQGL
jgi:hypothetical protein